MVKSDPSYQELKDKLEAVLGQLQHEDTDVDKALELHKEGKKILDQIETYLGDASKKAGLDIKIKKSE